MLNLLKQGRSIRSRLHLVSFMTVLVFAVIGTVIYIVAYRVGHEANQNIRERLQQTIDNSHNSRDFGQLHSRISVFRNTFFGNDPFFHHESPALKGELKRLQVNVTDVRISALLKQLSRQWDNYVERAEWINILLAWRSGQDRDLEDLLSMLQDLVVERKIDEALKGSNINYFEQLSLLVSGYRESLLEIAKLNAEEDRSVVLSAQLKDDPPLTAELKALSLRLRTLTASEPQIARLGRHLISRIDYYKYLTRLYQLDMIQLNQQNVEMELLTRQILSEMGLHDQRIAIQSMQTQAEIKQAVKATVTAILGLLTFLAALSWWAHHHLFKKHIQSPIEQVSRRLTMFQNGDHTTPLMLGRNDEWAQIEEIYNRTLSALQGSVSALRESETRYREIFNNATEGIFRATLAGQFIELNPAAVAMLGCQSVAEAKSHYTDLGSQLYLDPHVRDEMIERMKVQGPNLNFETVVRRKNGETFWCAVNNYLICSDDGDLFIEGTLKDISVSRAAQESLQQMQVYLQNIIDSMPSILIGLDHNMCVTLWNRHAEEESDLTAEVASGQAMRSVCRVFDPDQYLSAVDSVLRTRQKSRLNKVESLKKTVDGGSRYFDLTIYPVSTESDAGVVIHIDEVTERVRFEERMVRSEKMQSVGSLASGLAHEINNPLAAILQNAQVLSRRLSPELRQNSEVAAGLGITIESIAGYMRQRGCEKMLQTITDAGQKAAKIVANVQSFSRNDIACFSPCSVADLIERTLDLAASDYDMRHHYNFQNIQIVRDYNDVPEIHCEMSQIQQVLLVLFKNSAQAMSQHTDLPRLTIRVRRADTENICIQIEDNGPGMESDLCSRIFDPFYTTKEVGSGHGLGLSIAYFIVTHTHNGHVTVSSDIGRGSRFDVTLPINQG